MDGLLAKNGHRHAYFQGITLVELLVSISILAIIWAFTMPSFKTMILNNRLIGQADAFVGALRYARNTALSQNLSVIVCPYQSAGSTTCGGSWDNGYIVVSQPTSGNVLLQSMPRGTNDAVLSAVPISGVTASSVTFDARGLASTQANFKLCDSRGSAYARSVVVLPTGFIQSSSVAGVATWNGGAVTCP